MRTEFTKKCFAIPLLFIVIFILYGLPNSAYTLESGLSGTKADQDSIAIAAKVQNRDKDGWICLDINIKNISSTVLTNGTLRVAPAAMNSKFDFNRLKAKGPAGEQTAFYKENNLTVKPKTDLNRKVCLLWPPDQPLNKFLVFIFIEGRIGTKPVMVRQIITLNN